MNPLSPMADWRQRNPRSGNYRRSVCLSGFLSGLLTSTEEHSTAPSSTTFANIPPRFRGKEITFGGKLWGRRFIKASVFMLLYGPFQGICNRTTSNIVKSGNIPAVSDDAKYLNRPLHDRTAPRVFMAHTWLQNIACCQLVVYECGVLIRVTLKWLVSTIVTVGLA